MSLTQILLDAPASTVSRTQIAKLGDYKDKRYGAFSITAEDVADWKRNLSLLPGGRAPIDLDHSSDRPQPFRNTEAAAWITDVDLEDGKGIATLEWTPSGKSAVDEKRYLFFSPTYGPHKTEDGTTHANVLTGGALTNRPFLNMPAISLASDAVMTHALEQDPAWALYELALDGTFGADVKTLATTTKATRDKAVKDNNALPDGSYPIPDLEHLQAAIILARSGHGNVKAATALIKRRAGELPGGQAILDAKWPDLDGNAKRLSDSPAAMKVTEKIRKQISLDNSVSDEAAVEILKALGVADDADETAVITHLENAAKPTEIPSVAGMTLEQQAANEGMVLLDRDKFTALSTGAAAGLAAQKELHAAKFEHGWDEAVQSGKFTDAERPTYERFYELDADHTLKTLDAAPVRYQMSARGHSTTTVASTPVDPLEAANEKARKNMLDKGAGEAEYIKYFEAALEGRSL